MRKAVIVSLTAGLLVAMGLGVAQAAPAAPRAKAVASASTGAQQPLPQGFCINIDRDFRTGCFFGEPPPPGCNDPVISIGPVFTLWKCGPGFFPPRTQNCINFDRDGNVTCILGADPPAGCRESMLSVPGVITYYRCADRRSQAVPVRAAPKLR